MTVIKRKLNQNYPNPNSSFDSDSEALNLGSATTSDTESLNDEYNLPNGFRNVRHLPINPSHIEEMVHIKKTTGRKKLRRYQNKCVLQTLNEDENENLFIVMESYKGPFARLLGDKDALEYWNTFIEKSEEEQTQIMKEVSDKYKNHNAQEISDKAEPPYGRLSSRIRRTIKIRKNLSLEIVKGVEDELIEFFKTTPTAIYVRFPPTSFDRLLLHAIAQYHKLKSVSVLVEDMGKRSVEVHNANDGWTPPDYFLTDFIKQLRR